MIPARATARSASAITRTCGPSSRRSPSSVTSNSPPLGSTHDDGAAAELVEVEGMDRLAGLPEDEVGDVHDVVDRALADRLESFHQPVRARTHLDSLDQPRHIARAAHWVLESHCNLVFGALGELLGMGVRDVERLVEHHRHLPGQPQVIHAIGTVGGDIHIEQIVAVSLLDRFHRQPGGGQPLSDLRQRRAVVHILGEPVEGELHQ